MIGSLDEAMDEQVRAMKSTARARFKAHKRLLGLDRRLTWLVALTSSFIIILTVAVYVFRAPQCTSDTINIFTISLSIIILAASLIQYASQHSVNAEIFHRSALEINELRRDLELSDVNARSYAMLSSYTKQYSVVLQKYSLNHTDLDHNMALIERAHEHTWLTRGRIWIIKAQAMLHYIPLLFTIAVVSISLAMAVITALDPSLLCVGRQGSMPHSATSAVPPAAP